MLLGQEIRKDECSHEIASKAKLYIATSRDIVNIPQAGQYVIVTVNTCQLY